MDAVSGGASEVAEGRQRRDEVEKGSTQRLAAGTCRQFRAGCGWGECETRPSLFRVRPQQRLSVLEASPLFEPGFPHQGQTRLAARWAAVVEGVGDQGPRPLLPLPWTRGFPGS